jgi:hypothetical protein
MVALLVVCLGPVVGADAPSASAPASAGPSGGLADSAAARVEGSVTSQGCPLDGALVRAWAPADLETTPLRAGADPVAVTRTGEEGRFALVVPRPGTWTIRVSAPGLVGRETLVEVRDEARRLQDVDLPRARKLAVRVTGRGEELPGAELVWPTDETQASPPEDRWRLIPSVARTDHEGSASLTIAAGPLDELGGEIRLSAPGFEPARVSLLELPRGSGVSEAPVAVDLVPRRRGVGWVVDERDRPVEDAEVRLIASGGRDGSESDAKAHAEAELGPFRTKADGSFEVPDPPPGHHDLAVEAAGYGPLTVPGVDVPPGAGTIDLGVVSLTVGVELGGRVVDPDGRPVEAARVLLRPTGSEPWEVARAMGNVPKEVATDAGGEFVFRGLVDGSRVRLRVEKEGAVPRESPSLTLPLGEPIEIELPATATLSGWVVDAAGRAVPGALVTGAPESELESGRGASTGTTSVRASAHGDFEISGLRPGVLALTVSAPGYRDGRVAGLEVEAGSELTGVEIVLQEGANLEGLVVHGDGRPATGATVELADALGNSVAFARVDGSGSFRWSGLPRGPRSLVAVGANGARTTRTVDAGAIREVILELEGGTGVSGWVVRTDGSPVAGARVVLVSATPAGGSLESRTDTLGRFEWADVTDGAYHLFASADHLAPSRGRTVEVSGEPVAGLEVELEDGITVRGQVVGAKLDDLSSVVIRSRSGARSVVARVDYQGRFVLHHLPYGQVVLWAEAEGTGRCALERLDLPRGASEVEVLLSLAAGSPGC